MSEFELKFELRNVPIGELVENVGQIPNVPKNPRKITKERMAALIKSIKESPEMEKLNEIIVYPYDGKMVAVSGNHRLRARRELGWPVALCKVLDENTPAEKLREYVLKENMLYAQNDEDIMKNLWSEDAMKWDVPISMQQQKVTEYSRKIESPVYVPTGETIEGPSALYDESEVKDLEYHIKAADIPEDVRDMLLKSAQRFRKFDFSKVAEYYSQCEDPVIRALMERTAMVIVDFKQAIENGFVVLTDEITQEYLREYEE